MNISNDQLNDYIHEMINHDDCIVEDEYEYNQRMEFAMDALRTIPAAHREYVLDVVNDTLEHCEISAESHLWYLLAVVTRPNKYYPY